MLPFKKYTNIFQNSYYQDILNETPFKQNQIYSKGIWCLEPRKTCWMSDTNTNLEYSEKIMEPIKLTKKIAEIRNKLNDKFGIFYDSVLVNYYPDGGAGMRYHSDPLSNKWDTNFIIVSFGITRKLVFRKIADYDKKYTFQLNDGDCINMFDDCQDQYQHSIRKDKQINSGRISLVFKRNIHSPLI